MSSVTRFAGLNDLKGRDPRVPLRFTRGYYLPRLRRCLKAFGNVESSQTLLTSNLRKLCWPKSDHLQSISSLPISIKTQPAVSDKSPHPPQQTLQPSLSFPHPAPPLFLRGALADVLRDLHRAELSFRRELNDRLRGGVEHG